METANNYQMYDLHCHLLPGADDGADSIAEALHMLQLSAGGGCAGVVATPHSNLPGARSNLWEADFIDLFAALKGALEQSGLPIRLYPGQEILLRGSFLELLREGKLIPINNSEYLLVELDFQERAASAYRKIASLRAEGYRPILAHPERYAFFHEEADAAERVREAGALLQVNKGSLEGAFGRRIAALAFSLLDERQASFVASDGHSPYRRSPYLRDVHELISDIYSFDYANLLLHENPLRVLENRPVYGD